MPWPKGKPRKGYIKKDGTKPKSRKKVEVPEVQPDVGTDDVPVVSSEVQVDTTVSPQGSSGGYEGDIHGQVGTGAISAVCPNCGYAYADGGYCPDCGWMKPIVLREYGSSVGRRF